MLSSHLAPPISRILLGIAILAFLLYLGIFAVYAFALFRFPYDYDQGEGFELNDSILFSRGEWPYQDNETFPFYASNYGPVFHLMVVPLMSIFGHNLVAGRALSFGVTLLIGATVALVVYRRTRDRPIAILSGLAVIASNFVYHIGPLFRQHMTMVLFELLAVVAISGYDHPRHGRRNIVLSMLFLLLAGYTKQLSAATAAAVLGFLFLRAKRKSLSFGLGLTLAAGAVFLWINAATGGQWFTNVVTANANAYDYAQAVTLYGQFFSLHFVVVALALGFLVYELYWDRLSAYSVWLAFALVNAALSGKWGAGESYFVTAIVAACIASGLAIDRIKRATSRRWPRASAALGVVVPLLYLAQAWSVRHLPTDGPFFGVLAESAGIGRGASVYADYPYFDSAGYTQVGHLPTDDDVRNGDRIVQRVVSTGRPALTEEALFALRAGQPVVTNPTQLLNLWNNNAFDPTDLIAMIHDQAFGVIVLRAQFYPPPVLQAIGLRYEPIEDIWMNGFQYRLLGPRRDFGAGCDEARLYAMKHQLEQDAAGGIIRMASRDTAPEGWVGAQGVTEFVFIPAPVTSGETFRLWIAPRDWEATPPVAGGAMRIGSNSCFKFFIDASASQATRTRLEALLEIRP